MGRSIFIWIVGVLCLGCMEEEKDFSSKQLASEVSAPDSGGADVQTVEVPSGTDAVIEEDVADAADVVEVAEVADAADVVDAVEVAEVDDTSEEVSVLDGEVGNDVAVEVTETADIEVVDDVVDTAVDTTEIQEDVQQDTFDATEDVDAATEIAEDVSIVVDVGDAEADIEVDAQEVVDGDAAAPDVSPDVSPDIAPDAPPDVTSQDTEIDVLPPDPCLTLNCDDKNPCTLDSCNKTVGCSNAPTVVMCEDGNVCTVGDVCLSGACVADALTKCNDGNPCTTDACDPKIGCIFGANSLPCEDGDICTVGEKCSSGGCTAGQTKNCSDGNVCTSDNCDQVKGCVNDPMAGSCDDGNKCTESDVCSAGACLSGKAKVCDDGNACTSNVCDAVNECAYTQNWVIYDWKDAKLPLEWSLDGSMEVTCNNGYTSSTFKETCVLRVPMGAPAGQTSMAVLDLNWVRNAYNMGSGDIQIVFKWVRFQFANNGDVMTSHILGADAKNLFVVGLEGSEGTTKVQEFVVGLSGVKLKFQLLLGQYPVKTGPAVWGKVLIAPVGCTPPATP